MAIFTYGDTNLYYEESGAGEPLLLITGWGGTIDEFASLREELARSFRVIAVDAPGSGNSGPQPRTYTSTYYRDDIPLFLALLEALEATPAHLAGFSDGGEYELLMAAEYPECARSLVTWGAAGTLGTDAQFADLMANVIDDPIPPMTGFSEYMKGAYGEENARTMTRSAAAAFRTIIEAGGDISRSQADKIRCPALLITGEHDFLASPAVVRELAGAMANVEFKEAAGAGHPVHMECPDWLTRTVSTWLSGQSAGK